MLSGLKHPKKSQSKCQQGEIADKKQVSSHSLTSKKLSALEAQISTGQAPGVGLNIGELAELCMQSTLPPHQSSFLKSHMATLNPLAA